MFDIIDDLIADVKEDYELSGKAKVALHNALSVNAPKMKLPRSHFVKYAIEVLEDEGVDQRFIERFQIELKDLLGAERDAFLWGVLKAQQKEES
jgi:hypothetical protein